MPLKRTKSQFPIRVAHWCDEPGIREKEWLDKAWMTIKQRFFIDPTDKLGRAKLGLRAITLAMIYLDFCYLAWELESDTRYECEDWAGELGIDKKVLIKLAKAEGKKLTAKDFKDDKGLFAETIYKMANVLREEVFYLLCPNINRFSEIVEELSTINDSSEYHTILSKVYCWFSEKCSYPLQ